MRLPRLFFFAALSGLAALAQGADLAHDFLREHCLRCHDAKTTKGGLRLDQVGRDFSDLRTSEIWDEILLRITAGEMPPEEEKQPSKAAVSGISEWIHARLAEGSAQRLSKRGRVQLYRLSREEYAQTVGDLLGAVFDVQAPGGLNEDSRWRGFTRIGSLLTLSPSHVERYFEAAQRVVNEAFPERPVQPRKGLSEAANARNRELLAKAGITDPPRHLLLPGHTFGSIDARDSGTYRITVKLSALPSAKGRIPHLVVWDDVLKRSMDGADVVISEERPETVTFTVRLPRGRYSLLNQAPGTFETFVLSATTQTPFTHSKERRLVLPYTYRLFDDAGRAVIPLMLVDSVEWEGPLPDAAVQALRAQAMPSDDSVETIRTTLGRFLERCWRRPAQVQELDEYMALISKERAAGETPRSAYLSALVSALASKNFYQLHEGTPTEDRKHLTAWELISRLSYFLWSSMPDERLFASARDGSILKPDVLRGEVVRMLDDARANALVDHFAAQWLQLHRVGAFPPDPELYPEYDRWLEQSMVEESKRFFGEVLRKNLSITEFLDSNWTMLNPRLALHYGMKPSASGGFARVGLDAATHRGGLLTQASLLSLTSDGTRHRPVHRGVLVSETIFGRTPPPPPPNVEPLEPTPSDSPKATVRMQLAAHAKNAVCASCHERIDPLGFAFDHFDALGRWRDREFVGAGLGEDPLVDASGTLPNSGRFQGPSEFKALLKADSGRFAEAFAGQAATYALRRVTTRDDQPAIAAITHRLTAKNYPLRDLITELATSELFLRR
ncbi:MAG: hypothetical protein RIS92_2074 [Verrucomicrobiota bacterium]|jgi:hypothetical protein